MSAAEYLTLVNQVIAKTENTPVEKPLNGHRGDELQQGAEVEAKNVPVTTTVSVVEPSVPPPMAETIAAKFVQAGSHVIFFPRGTKRCTVPGWEQKATNDLNAALVWAAQDPYANVGIVGKQDGLWAADDDADLLAEYERQYGPIQTYTTRTVSGGRHFIFRQNAESWAMGNVSIHDEQGRELLSARVDDRYVVAAGSWAYPDNDTTKPLTQYVAVDANAPIVEVPSSLIAFIKAKDAEYKGKKSEKPSAADEPRQYHEGGRNTALTRKAGKLREAGMTADEIEPILSRMNQEICVPPLPESEITSISKSVGKYPAGKDERLILTGATAPGAAGLNPTTETTDPIAVSNWQTLFRSVGEMEDGPIDMIIEGALQEGTCFLGANPGEGKTLVALAFAKAICTGEPLFNLPQFAVKQPRTVIYLIPESRDRAFRKRCEAFGLPNDKTKFMARTISAGVPLDLADPRLLEAVRVTRGVVFLDTASRFMKSNDENAAAQNRFLVNDVIALLAAGAVCVVIVHHATKAAKQEEMRLENMLRGTSDLGAMCDQAYGIKKDTKKYANGSGPMEITLANLKDREQVATNGLSTLRLAASWKEEKRADGIHQCIFPVSYIDTTGNFKVVSEAETVNREIRALEALVASEPNMSAKELAATLTQTTEYRVLNQLKKLRYHRVQGGQNGASPWHKDTGGTCPYEKVDAVEIKPAKKTYNLSVTEAAKKLEAYLAEEGPVTVVNVHKWADKEGITDAVLAKAKKRVNVIVDEGGTWGLPAGDPARAF